MLRNYERALYQPHPPGISDLVGVPFTKPATLEISTLQCYERPLMSIPGFRDPDNYAACRNRRMNRWLPVWCGSATLPQLWKFRCGSASCGSYNFGNSDLIFADSGLPKSRYGCRNLRMNTWLPVWCGSATMLRVWKFRCSSANFGIPIFVMPIVAFRNPDPNVEFSG